MNRLPTELLSRVVAVCTVLGLMCFCAPAWAQKSFQTITSGPVSLSPEQSQSLSQAAGTSISFLTPGNFTRAFSQPILFLQRGLTLADIHSMQGASAASPYTGSLADVVTCGQLIPAGAANGQANCYSAFQRAFAPINPVGFYSREEPAVDGITEWGSNFNLSDRDDVTGVTHSGTTEFAQELDVNVTSSTTAGAALFFGSIFEKQPANLGAMHLPLPNLYSGNQWSYGFIIDDGAVKNPAVRIGTSEVPPDLSARFGKASSGSQNLELMWRDPTAHDHASTVRVDADGAFHLASEHGVQVDQGNLIVAAGMLITPALTVTRGVSAGSGLQHLRIPLGCNTAATVGAICVSAPAIWAIPFADAHYTLVCTLEQVTGVPVVSSVAKTPGSFTLTAVAMTAASATGVADCIAMHDP